MVDDDARSTDLRTARTAGVPAATFAAPIFALTVVDGADKGASLRLEASMPSRGLVGKSPACALRLTDPHVSRRHLALDPTHQGLHVTDLGSTNGTYVNGLRVVEAFLVGGEALRIGETTLRVDLVARAEQV